MPNLAQKAFEAICLTLSHRVNDIEVFAETGYSFEEWCNWEAYAACQTIPNCNVCPKPRYCDFGVEDCRDFADLSISNSNNEAVLIEIALVHDNTQNKWLDKLRGDQTKLERACEKCSQTLRVIVLVSTKAAIENAPAWKDWRGPSTSLSVSVKLKAQGQMLIKGFVVDSRTFKA
jgi:hypothetical protein